MSFNQVHSRNSYEPTHNPAVGGVCGCLGKMISLVITAILGAGVFALIGGLCWGLGTTPGAIIAGKVFTGLAIAHVTCFLLGAALSAITNSCKQRGSH